MDNYYTSFEFTKWGLSKSLLKGQNEVHDYDFYASGTFIDYVTRSDAVYIQDNNSQIELLDMYKSSNLSFKDWYNTRNKQNLKSNKSGAYKLFEQPNDVPITDIKDNYKSISKDQHIWEMIINLGSDGEKYFFINKESWNDALNKTLPTLLRKNNLSSNNIDGYWAIHCNTGNPHIHLSFWEKVPSIEQGGKFIYRPKGAFNKYSLTMFEKMFKAEVQAIATMNSNQISINEIRKSKKEIWDKRKEIKNELKNSLKMLNDELLCLNKVKEIKAELNNKDNKTFANLSEANKQNVFEIFNYLISNNEEFKHYVDSYKNTLNQIEDKEYPSEFLDNYVNSFIEKENNEFMSQVGNIICKTIDALETKNYIDYYVPQKRKSEIDWIIKRWEWEANRALWIKKQQAIKNFKKEVLN
ncbi:hypothetical protein ACNQ2T_00960 [Mycoplasma sp. Z407A]|uniref:hypothetical protein n=1 Tax=Mycoplasma sp. Z407A TaxID=3401678 RepID=UPI003AAD872A